MKHQHCLQPEERLILVNKADQIIGHEKKAVCHQREGLLHRAFSIFLFNDRQQLLLQQRSAEKPLWPLFWSNSVCSHPREGETYQTATLRRLKEELGIETRLRFLFQFHYQAAFGNVGSEHELCSVYIGHSNRQQIRANPDEIADWKYIDLDVLTQNIYKLPESYTPWFKIEWTRIQQEYFQEIRE